MEPLDRHPRGAAAAQTASRTVCMELMDEAGDGLAVDAELLYDAADPYAVTVVFDTVRGPVRWMLARELLSQGWLEPTGDGDVHVWPCLSSTGCAVTMIELCSPTGDVLLQVDTGDVLAFLGQSRAVVEPGTESDHLDLDAGIRALLAADPA